MYLSPVRVNNHNSSYSQIGSIHTTLSCQTNLWQIAGRHSRIVFSLNFGKGRRQVVQCQLDFLVFQMYGFQNKLRKVLWFFMIIFCIGGNCKSKLIICPVPTELIQYLITHVSRIKIVFATHRMTGSHPMRQIAGHLFRRLVIDFILFFPYFVTGAIIN